jgi:hypothetical protein
MSTDLYNKVIHTLIAMCLLYFVLRDISPIQETHAQDRLGYLSTVDLSEKIRNPSGREIMDVNIVSVAGKNIRDFDVGNVNPALPVKIFE